jgi:hypothetical protein
MEGWGWKPTQKELVPLKYVDKNGVPCVVRGASPGKTADPTTGTPIGRFVVG